VVGGAADTVAGAAAEIVIRSPLLRNKDRNIRFGVIAR
jgi:hypothetical protein